MVSLILIVFVSQLTIHIVSTIGAKTINEILWLLYSRLPTPHSKQASSNLVLRREVVKLHREMTNTSAQDDFAKWAKLRRQHDKKKAEYESNAASLQSFRTTFDRIVSALRWVGTTGSKSLIQFWFSKQAIFWLPQGWVPCQVEWLLSVPRAPMGSISVQVWWIACAGAIQLVTEAVAGMWALRDREVKVGSGKGEKVGMEAMGAGRGRKEL